LFLQYCGTREPDEYHIRKAAEFIAVAKDPWVSIGHKDVGSIKTRAKDNVPGTAKDGAGMFWLRLFADYDGDKCLLFPFRTAINPRGVVTYNFKPTPAHRAMCIHVHKLPKDEAKTKTMALHSCGNGHLGCVNPKHLYWGDQSDNAKDARRHATEGKPICKDPPKIKRAVFAVVTS
jgi:hypothetical protein